jgi:hypothetical protein
MKMTCCKGGEASHLGWAVKLDSEENVCFLRRSLILRWLRRKERATRVVSSFMFSAVENSQEDRLLLAGSFLGGGFGKGR